jgi:hypothetical protein
LQAAKTAGLFPNCPLVQRLGHLPLEQVIGVRIPGGQPNRFKHAFFLQLISTWALRLGEQESARWSASARQ